MNFVDLLLKNIALVSASEVIDTALDKWSSTRHGITEENVLKYPQFINNLLHIVDFDISASFEGLVSFVLNCDRVGFLNTIKAFRQIDDQLDADLLEEIFCLEEVQNLYGARDKTLPDEAVERIIILASEMYFNRQNTDMWRLLKKYLERELYSYTLHTKNGLTH